MHQGLPIGQNCARHVLTGRAFYRTGQVGSRQNMPGNDAGQADLDNAGQYGAGLYREWNPTEQSSTVQLN